MISLLTYPRSNMYLKGEMSVFVLSPEIWVSETVLNVLQLVDIFAGLYTCGFLIVPTGHLGLWPVLDIYSLLRMNHTNQQSKKLLYSVRKRRS